MNWRNCLSEVADSRNREKSVFFLLYFRLFIPPPASLGTLWPLVCMANHTIVLITASQQAPSKSIHNVARTHSDTRCSFSQTHTFIWTHFILFGCQLKSDWFCPGDFRGPTAKNTHFCLTYVSVQWKHEAKNVKIKHTNTRRVTWAGQRLHYSFPQIGNTGCALTHNKQGWIHQQQKKNPPKCKKNMKNLIVPQNKKNRKEMYKINILCYLLYLFFITNLFRNEH